jgi:hypothetical protein
VPLVEEEQPSLPQEEQKLVNKLRRLFQNTEFANFLQERLKEAQIARQESTLN